MMRLFRRSLGAGIVTGAYPDSPEPAPRAYRGQVTLRTDRCSGDGACARVCPSQAIAVTRQDRSWVWELTDARCVFCGLCMDVCPTRAIALSNEFELAVRGAGDLTTRVVFAAEEPS
jgi:hydrogenase-4 component H